MEIVMKIGDLVIINNIRRYGKIIKIYDKYACGTLKEEEKITFEVEYEVLDLNVLTENKTYNTEIYEKTELTKSLKENSI